MGLAILAWGCQAGSVNEVQVREVLQDNPVPTFTPTPELAGHTPALHGADTVTPVPSLPTEALKTGPADVCTRTQIVRQLIVEALDLNGCEEATWEQLTQVRKLGRYRKDPFVGQGLGIVLENEHDLDGLVNLEEIFVYIRNLDTDLPRLAQLAESEGLRTLALRATDVPALPADLLIHTPQLTTLLLAANKIGSIPEGLLAPTPELTALTLYSSVSPELPADFLTYTPHLKSLGLHTRLQQKLPADFLVPVPELKQLSISTLGSLPASLLVHTPQLTTLKVSTDEALSPHFLVPTPLLESLRLESQGWESIPSPLLHAVPRLTFLDLAFPDTWNTVPADFLTLNPQVTTLGLFLNYTELPGDFLKRFPALETLSLSPGQIQIPSQLLAYTPQLTEVDLYAGNLPGLPAELFAFAPQLTKLTLGLSSWPDLGHRVPEGFLESAPNLREATIRTKDLSTLPSTFMSHIPRLDMLDLQLGEMAFLPDSFLANAPQLSSLTLEANYLTALPPGFLASTPQLSRLDMTAYHLQALPERFMAHAPRLQQLCLLAELVTYVPAKWLSHMPELSEVDLYLFHIFRLPSDFLAFAPRISKLDLILGRDFPLDPPQGHLGELLARHGVNYRTTVSWPDVLNIRKSLGIQPDNLMEQVSEKSDIYVLGRQKDDSGRLWLNFRPVYLSGSMESFRRNGLWMAADYAVPVLDSYRAHLVGRNPFFGLDGGNCAAHAYN